MSALLCITFVAFAVGIPVTNC